MFCWVGVQITCRDGIFQKALSGATLLGDHTAVKQHMPDVVLGPHMQLRACCSESLEVCVAVGVNVPLQLYYLAMNHEPSLQPAHCALKVKQTN